MSEREIVLESEVARLKALLIHAAKRMEALGDIVSAELIKELAK